MTSPTYTFLMMVEMTDNDDYGWSGPDSPDRSRDGGQTPREAAQETLETQNEGASKAGAYEATIDPDLWVTLHQVAGGHEIDVEIHGPYFTEKTAIAKAKELTEDYTEQADDDGYVYGDGYSTEVVKLGVAS